MILKWHLDINNAQVIYVFFCRFRSKRVHNAFIRVGTQSVKKGCKLFPQLFFFFLPFFFFSCPAAIFPRWPSGEVSIGAAKEAPLIMC